MREKADDDSDIEDSLTTYIKALKNDFFCDVCVYGEDNEVDPRLEARRIEKLEDKSFEKEGGFGCQVLLLFDRKGTVELSDEDWNYIFDYVTQKDHDVVYFGTKYLGKIQELFGANLPEGEKGVGIYGSSKLVESRLGVILMSGVWKDDEEMCCERTGDEAYYLTYAFVPDIYFICNGEM